MIFKLTHVQAKQLPWFICYFLVFIQFHVNGQNGEIRDCNGKEIITQVMVRSSNNQPLTLTNCIYTLDNELGLNLANDAHYNGKGPFSGLMIRFLLEIDLNFILFCNHYYLYVNYLYGYKNPNC